MKPNLLIKTYPQFLYRDYSYQVSKNNLEIFFDFKIVSQSGREDIVFKPKIKILNVDEKRIEKVKKFLDNLIFNLGLIEAVSYWKATCSPEIKIECNTLNTEEINWWKELIISGMGQFFYENKINWQSPNFLNIIPGNIDKTRLVFKGRLKNRVLVPVGGGKDSIVSLEIFKKSKFQFNCFSLNPTNTSRKVMDRAGCEKPIIVERKIDPKLLELNLKGFLNGHTPFSAYLAFLSAILGLIFDYQYLAFSNERSSEEGNLLYLGKEINHQYSKSFAFETAFRKHCRNYLIKNLEYFSFLKPLYEIQISKLFSRYRKYFSVFVSCNEAYKTNSGSKTPKKKWCNNCAKCLFIFSCLYPFVKKDALIKIFGENLFEKKELLPLMKELLGVKSFKPFECVGTKKESLVAFYLSWKKANRIGEKPILLERFEKEILPREIRKGFTRGFSQYAKLEKESFELMTYWNKKHFLKRDFESLLKRFLIVEKF